LGKNEILNKKIIHYRYIPILFIKVVGKNSWVSHPPSKGNNWHLGAFREKTNLGNQVGGTLSSTI
jgi:hypothetical protein